MKKAPVFVREATGLVRSISPWTMFWANMGEIGFGTGLLLMNTADSYLPNGNPGGNVVAAVGIFTIFALFLGYIYYHVTHTVGRTGGDYVWMSRNLGPVLGAALPLGMSIGAGLAFLPISLNWLFTLSLGPSIATIGVVTNNPSLVSFVSTFEAPAFLAVASLVILGLIVAVDIISPRSGFLLLSIFTVLATVATLMLGAVFLSLGPSGIQGSMTTFLAQNNASYTQIASQYTASTFDFPAIVLLLPYVAFFMPWINNVGSFSGELKNLKRSAVFGSLLPVIVSGGVLIIFLQMYYSYMGFGFAIQAPNSWPSSLTSIGASPNMLTVATVAFKDSVPFIWVMNIGFAFWYMAAVQESVLAMSRYVMAMSFDRLLPARFAYVSDKSHSPVVALLLAPILCIPVILIASFTSWLYVFSSNALGTVFFTFLGITAILYGFKNRDSLKNVSWILMLSGIIVAGFFACMTYMYVFLPYYGFNAVSETLILVIWVVGVLLYPISKFYLKRKDIDVSLIFKQLPPE